jgi:hypothetical protein
MLAELAQSGRPRRRLAHQDGGGARIQTRDRASDDAGQVPC